MVSYKKKCNVHNQHCKITYWSDLYMYQDFMGKGLRVGRKYSFVMIFTHLSYFQYICSTSYTRTYNLREVQAI